MAAAAGSEIAEAAERAEALGWEDLVRAAPPSLATEHSIATWRVDRAVGFSFDNPSIPLFNRVIGLGVLAPLTPSTLDTAIAPWHGTGRTYVVHGMPDEQPPDLSRLLEARGFRPSRNWIKMVRRTDPALQPPPTTIRVEEVGDEQASTFGELAAGMAGVPGLAPWLAATVGRSGWHTYLAFDGTAPISIGQLYVADGLGWLFNGEHPASEHPEAQRAIAARRAGDGLALGCRVLISEAVEPSSDSPSNTGYDALLQAGFEPGYRRRNWIGTAPTAPA